MSTKQKLVRLGVALIVFGVVFGLAALWWWALFGMSERVGWAWQCTVLAAVFGGGMVAAVPISEAP